MKKIGYRFGVVSESVLIGDYHQERLNRDNEFEHAKECNRYFREGKVVMSKKVNGENEDDELQLHY